MREISGEEGKKRVRVSVLMCEHVCVCGHGVHANVGVLLCACVYTCGCADSCDVVSR